MNNRVLFIVCSSFFVFLHLDVIAVLDEHLRVPSGMRGTRAVTTNLGQQAVLYLNRENTRLNLLQDQTRNVLEEIVNDVEDRWNLRNSPVDSLDYHTHFDSNCKFIRPNDHRSDYIFDWQRGVFVPLGSYQEWVYTFIGRGFPSHNCWAYWKEVRSTHIWNTEFKCLGEYYIDETRTDFDYGGRINSLENETVGLNKLLASLRKLSEELTFIENHFTSDESYLDGVKEDIVSIKQIQDDHISQEYIENAHQWPYLMAGYPDLDGFSEGVITVLCDSVNGSPVSLVNLGVYQRLSSSTSFSGDQDRLLFQIGSEGSLTIDKLFFSESE